MQGPDVGTQSGILVIAQNPRHAAASVYAENCPYRTGHRGMSKLRQVYEIETYQLYELKPVFMDLGPLQMSTGFVLFCCFFVVLRKIGREAFYMHVKMYVQAARRRK